MGAAPGAVASPARLRTPAQCARGRVVTATAARDLHVGDVWHEHDWALTVCAVTVEGNSVAFVVREFPTTLQHRAGGDMLEIDQAVGL